MKIRRYPKRSSQGNSVTLFPYCGTRAGMYVYVSDSRHWAVSRRSTGEPSLLPDGATVTNGDCFIYGGGLTAAFETYLTDRVMLLLQVKERALFGTDAGNFHTQVGLGVRLIIN